MSTDTTPYDSRFPERVAFSLSEGVHHWRVSGCIPTPPDQPVAISFSFAGDIPFAERLASDLTRLLSSPYKATTPPDTALVFLAPCKDDAHILVEFRFGEFRGMKGLHFTVHELEFPRLEIPWGGFVGLREPAQQPPAPDQRRG